VGRTRRRNRRLMLWLEMKGEEIKRGGNNSSRKEGKISTAMVDSEYE
jgi:hypothetical protein